METTMKQIETNAQKLGAQASANKNTLFSQGLLILLLSALSGCTTVLDVVNTGPIQQDHGGRSMGSAISDSNIESVITVNIRKTSSDLRAAHINVIVYNGIVLLLGQVPSEGLRETVANIAANANGVRQVNNALTVGEETSASVRGYDGWLTTKVKTKIMDANDIDSGHIKVVTENGVVYLMGVVTKQEGDRAASIAQATDGAQRIVKVFEYIN